MSCRSLGWLALVLVLLLAACAPTDGAQDNHRDDGFYGGVSGGATHY